MNDEETSVVVSVAVLDDGEYAIVLEFDNDHIVAMHPSMAKSIAENIITAVGEAEKMGWEEDEGISISTYPAPCDNVSN